MAMTENRLNWGICGKDGGATPLLFEPSLIAYSGRQGLQDATGCFTIGGEQDQIVMDGGKGSFFNRPLRTPFFGREIEGVNAAGVIYNLRIEYDIVTLTTQEQADLYSRGLCS